MKKEKINLVELHRLYVKKQKTLKETSQLLGLSVPTVRKYLKINGWHDENRQKLRDEFGRFIFYGQVLPPQNLENSPAFKNGNSIYRKICALHHPKVCFHCGKTKNLHVHHLDRNRENNHFSNLRWVCGSCHMRIEHADRLFKRDEKGRFV